MKPRNLTMLNPLPMIAALAMVTLFTAVASEAKAACFPTREKNSFAAPKVQFDGWSAGQSSFDDGGPSAAHDSIVGMWNVEFLIGNGPDRYDQSFQQFHSDGTEIMLSNGLPPALGNVCVGVWKKTGERTVKLRHMTWNWDVDGHFAGTFVMLVTLRVDRRGNSFAGTWSADSYDLSGTVIPELHAEGVVKGTRITVD
jgi:hypothetical protein